MHLSCLGQKHRSQKTLQDAITGTEEHFFLQKKKKKMSVLALFFRDSYFSVKKKQLNFTSFFRIPVFYVPFKAAKSCLPCQSFLFMRKAEPILLGLTVKYVTDGSGSFPLSR